MSIQTRSPRRSRTVFDLTPQELQQLYQHNVNVNASVPPARPKRSSAQGSYSDYAFDFGIYERYRDLHARAKSERSAWLKEHRISHKVAAQAAIAHYEPYVYAARIGCVAPPMPEGYAQAMAAWRDSVLVPKQTTQPPLSDEPAMLPGGLRGFSF